MSHFQQHPEEEFQAGKSNRSFHAFQSARNCARAPRTGKGEPARALRSKRWIWLLSDACENGVWSWRSRGQTPLHIAMKLQRMISKTSCHVFVDTRDFRMLNKGTLRLRSGPVGSSPGRFMLRTSTDADLSHFVGTPSCQRPRATVELRSVASTRSMRARSCSSSPALCSSTSKSPWRASASSTSCGSRSETSAVSSRWRFGFHTRISATNSFGQREPFRNFVFKRLDVFGPLESP